MENYRAFCESAAVRMVVLSRVVRGSYFDQKWNPKLRLLQASPWAQQSHH